MHNARRKAFLSALKIFDVALMIAAFLVAACVALEQNRPASVTQLLSARIKIQNFATFSGFVYLWHIVFCLSGLYASRRLSKREVEIGDVVKATSIATIFMIVGAVCLHIRLMTPLFVILFWAQSTASTALSRWLLRESLSYIRKCGRNLQHIVIVGTNARALTFADTLAARSELGYRVVGFVDQNWGGIHDFQKRGHTLVSEIDSFPLYLRNSVVDEVVIALPFRSMHDQASRIAACCEQQGIKVRVLANILGLKDVSSGEDLEDQSLFAHSGTYKNEQPVILKRTLDLLLAFIGIALFSPIVLLIAILLKLTSSGPVFFVQKRVGLNKRLFSVYKFRTMVLDAEQRMAEVEHLNEVSGPVFKIKNDPRITSLGRFLRKTSLDELPQLINVIKGDMSLVGPRPLPVRDYKAFSEDWQRRRFSVRPGITCLWQVLGRNSIPFEEWMELDMQYIDRWSIWLDFKILLQTIPAVFRGSGAA